MLKNDSKLTKYERAMMKCTLKALPLHYQFRKVVRVNDRAGLEIRYTLMGIGGLNPSPSA